MKGATRTLWSPPTMMRRRSDLPPVAPQPWSALIPPDSFHARLAGMRDVPDDDDTHAMFYDATLRCPAPTGERGARDTTKRFCNRRGRRNGRRSSAQFPGSTIVSRGVTLIVMDQTCRGRIAVLTD